MCTKQPNFIEGTNKNFAMQFEIVDLISINEPPAGVVRIIFFKIRVFKTL